MQGSLAPPGGGNLMDLIGGGGVYPLSRHCFKVKDVPEVLDLAGLARLDDDMHDPI